MTIDFRIERVGDTVLVAAEDEDRIVTFPLSLPTAERIGRLLLNLVSGVGRNQLDLLDQPGGIDRR